MSLIRGLLIVLPVLCNALTSINISKDLKLSYFINLDRMPTRREHMEDQLNLSGLHAQRHMAVDWRRVALGEFDQEFISVQGIVPDLFEKPAKEGNGTIGCFLSHLQVLMEAGKKLKGANDIALIMEDDIAIPEHWQYRLQKAVDAAPTDWELLKLSGWGSARVEDLMNKSESLSDTKVNEVKVKTTTPRPSLVGAASPEDKSIDPPESMWSKFLTALKSMFNDEDTDVTFFRMQAPFTEPAHWNWGTMGWGSPNYFYSGSGAYLVRGTSIQKIIHHLRHQMITDLDAMFLSNGTMHFYEGWPHVFKLAHDAFHGPGLHGSFKAIDEFDKTWSKSDMGNLSDSTTLGRPEGRRDLESNSLQPWQSGNSAELNVVNSDGEEHTVKLGTRSQLDVDEGRTVTLGVLKGGAAVVVNDSLADAYDNVAEKSIIRNSRGRVNIKRHGPQQESPDESAVLKSLGPAGSVGELDDSGPGPARGAAPSDTYGHPAWLKSCTSIYLDVGSNSGGQIRKLFEPENYTGSPMLRVFNENIGAPEDRRLPSASTGLCALGMEDGSNPAKRAELKSLEDKYSSRGWNVHFYPLTAWREDGKIHNEASLRDRTVRGRSALYPPNLADFVRSLPPQTVKVLKVDIDGADFLTVSQMLQQKVLCQGTVDVAIFDHYDKDVREDERKLSALLKQIKKADCGEAGLPTNIFLETELERSAAHRSSMCAFGLSVFALAAFIGYQKFRGETIIEKIDNFDRRIPKGIS